MIINRNIKITKEEYDTYQNMDSNGKTEFVESKIPVQDFIGYGVYGIHVQEDEGNYSVEYQVGSSCD